MYSFTQSILLVIFLRFLFQGFSNIENKRQPCIYFADTFLPMNDIKQFEYQGHFISFEFTDGNNMINATQMAKPFGKRVNNFLQNKQTQDYITFLESRYWNSSIGGRKQVLRIVK